MSISKQKPDFKYKKLIIVVLSVTSILAIFLSGLLPKQALAQDETSIVATTGEINMPEHKSDFPFMKVISIILPVFAILVAYLSYVNSKQALSLSEDAATLSSRPYLVIAAFKPKDRVSFITYNMNAGIAELEVWFSIENKGNSPAYSVLVDKSKIEFQLVDESGKDKTENFDLNLQFPEAVAIGPHHIIDLSAKLIIDGVIDHNHMAQLDNGATLPVEINISYDGKLGDKTTRYTSPYKAVLSHDRARILSSGM